MQKLTKSHVTAAGMYNLRPTVALAPFAAVALALPSAASAQDQRTDSVEGRVPPQTSASGYLTAIARQVQPRINCDALGDGPFTVQVKVRVHDSGWIVGQPQVLNPRGDPGHLTLSESVIRALRAAEPFETPAGFEEQDVIFAFDSRSTC
jgi:hypothetical protein